MVIKKMENNEINKIVSKLFYELESDDAEFVKQAMFDINETTRFIFFKVMSNEEYEFEIYENNESVYSTTILPNFVDWVKNNY